jgi:Predicted membrane protein (DUF2232)
MPTNTLLLAIAAGIISAVVFASATTGPMLLRFVLFFLTPITLYLAGLGLGPVAAAIAVIVATLIILLLTNPIAALVFAVSAGMPAAMTTRLALLGRQGDAGASAPMEWYPLGRIIAAAAFFAGLFTLLALTLMGGDTAVLTKAMHEIVETFVKTELPQIPGSVPVTAAQIDEMTNRALGLLPATLAALSLVTTLLNLWLAGRITLASGRLPRPWPDLSGFSLPSSASFLLMITLALSFTAGLPGMMAGGFAGAYMMAFALLGLAVAHALTRGSAWRNFILTALYAGLLFFTPGVALVLAIAGLAETIFHYRAAPKGSAPNDPKT